MFSLITAQYVMTGQSSFEKSSTIPNAILGFLFSQQKYFINIELINTVITNIISQSVQLVYFEYNLNVITSVSIYNSRFTNITSKTTPLVTVKIMSLPSQVSGSLIAFTRVRKCIFRQNYVSELIVVENFPMSSVVRFEIISTKVIQNNGAGIT